MRPWSASSAPAIGWRHYAPLLIISACATTDPASKLAAPSRPLDLFPPSEQPEEASMAGLPAAWDQEAHRAAYRIETGPLQGAGNFNDLDGQLLSAYARNPYAVAEGADQERRMITRLPSDPARPFMDTGNKAFGEGKLDEAVTAYRGVIERDPLYAKSYFYLAEIESKRHDLDAATAWNDRGLRLSPRDSYGHAMRAEIALALGRDEQGRAALALALALDPFSPRALKLLRQIGGARTPGVEPPIFVKLQAGAQSGDKPVLVARAGGHPAWQRYALCRALLAHDARIRSEFIQSPMQQQRLGTRSLEEETTCGYMVTAAYRAGRGAGPVDADLERWSRAYDSNLLREAVIYDTLGCRGVEVLPLLNDEIFARVADYVRRFVMPPAPGAPPITDVGHAPSGDPHAPSGGPSIRNDQ